VAVNYAESVLPSLVVVLLTDWFLFASDCLRISSPLVIEEEQIIIASKLVLTACEKN
jgi:hypothetical protein